MTFLQPDETKPTSKDGLADVFSYYVKTVVQTPVKNEDAHRKREIHSTRNLLSRCPLIDYNYHAVFCEITSLYCTRHKHRQTERIANSRVCLYDGQPRSLPQHSLVAAYTQTDKDWRAIVHDSIILTLF